MGKLLAVQVLDTRIIALLQSGYSAQSQQLPDSANADFADVLSILKGARAVLALASPSGKYGHITSLLAVALHWSAQAATNGRRSPSRSERDYSRASTVLLQVGALLNRSPEAPQPPTIAAENAALALAARISAPPRPAHHRARTKKRHTSLRPRHLLVATARPPTATPWPTWTPQPTATATPPPTATSTPRPSPTPTATPKPTSTPRPTAMPSPTPRPTVAAPKHPAVTVLSPAIIQLIADTSAHAASTVISIKTCQAEILSLASGTDPLGSAQILGCLGGAGKHLERLDHDLSSAGHRHMPATLTRSLARARKNVAQAQHELHTAATSISIAHTDTAQAELNVAITDIGTVSALFKVLR